MPVFVIGKEQLVLRACVPQVKVDVSEMTNAISSYLSVVSTTCIHASHKLWYCCLLSKIGVKTTLGLN